MKQLKLKAVIFDMDGVITDTMPFHYRAWRKIFKNEGLLVSEKEIYLREGQPGNITIKEIFSERGLKLTPETLARILSSKEEKFKKSVCRRFIRGSRPFIHLLKIKGFMLALVTGTARNEVKKILPKKLSSMFDVSITGDEVKHGKPDPEPYLLALKRLKIKAKDAIVLENAPFGILSAKSAGLRCIALETSLPKRYLQKADYVYSSYKSLVNSLELAPKTSGI